MPELDIGLADVHELNFDQYFLQFNISEEFFSIWL